MQVKSKKTPITVVAGRFAPSTILYVANELASRLFCLGQIDLDAATLEYFCFANALPGVLRKARGAGR